MKKIGIGIFALLTLAIFIPYQSYAATIPKIGPIRSHAIDTGTCGNNWAKDTFDRYYSVTQNKDGTYTLHVDVKAGTFITTAGASPASCQTEAILRNIPGGISGTMQGYLDARISEGTYNQNATCGQLNCQTTAGFISTFFPGARYNITDYYFFYSTDHRGEWKNASESRGGNHGDIF